MDIRELLRTDLMIMDLKAQTKAEVIDEMVRNLFEKGGRIGKLPKALGHQTIEIAQ